MGAVQSSFASTTATPRPLHPYLDVRELRHGFGPRRVLEGISFAVGKAQIYGLLGPNGSGKSTALRALTGLLKPDHVDVRLDGERCGAGDRRMRTCMGVVFQQPSLDDRLSARSNLELSAALYGMSGRDAAERMQELLSLAGLADRAAEPAAHLSGGMRRRLELVRALLPRPELLVLDEPTSGLDEASFRSMWERIELLRAREQLTVLLSTHRPDEAQRCDRLAVLDQGAVIAEGTPQELTASVGGDVLTLEGPDPVSLADAIQQRFELQPRVVDERVVLVSEQGHALVPRLVEGLPAGSIATLSMHRPTMADVFAKLTGRALEEDTSR